MSGGNSETFLVREVLAWSFAGASVVTSWRVFRANSMVRAAFWLLASFLGVAGILVLLGAEFLGLVLVLMMAGEMTIMAIFMVMFMMNPAGLNPMMMVHQHRTAIMAGVTSFLTLSWMGLTAQFPDASMPAAASPTVALGTELLGDSMLVFETAGVVLLATMIGSIAIAGHRGRFGDAESGSIEPELAGSDQSQSAVSGESEDLADTHAGMRHDGMQKPMGAPDAAPNIPSSHGDHQ